MKKINELDLISNNNIYWWLEDDWSNKNNFDFFKLSEIIFKFNNSAMTLAENSSLGSLHRTIMNGSYILVIFLI